MSSEIKTHRFTTFVAQQLLLWVKHFNFLYFSISSVIDHIVLLLYINFFVLRNKNENHHILH